MRAAWRGADVELLVEPTASVTAENASRALPLLLEREIRRAVVVCAPLHLYRTRFFFPRLYGTHGVETEFRVAPSTPERSGAPLEAWAATACRRQLRAAGRSSPRRRPRERRRLRCSRLVAGDGYAAYRYTSGRARRLGTAAPPCGRTRARPAPSPTRRAGSTP